MSNLKLSEAIRLGAMLRPQCRDDYFKSLGDFRDTTAMGSCALGAAYEASFGIDLGNEWVDDDKMEERFPILLSPTTCPACGHQSERIAGAVPHLNDTHRWTRERIADWVETIEAQQDAAQPQTTEDETQAVTA